MAVSEYTTTVSLSTGSIYRGYSISLPGKYDRLDARAMTLQLLRDDKQEEWFKETKQGRREGEKPVHVITRYDLKNNTHISAFISPEDSLELDFETVKEELRGHAKRENEVGNGLAYFEIKEEREEND